LGCFQGAPRAAVAARLAAALEPEGAVSLAELRASRALRAGVEVYLRLLGGASDVLVLSALIGGLEKGALRVPEVHESAVWNLRLRTWSRFGGASEWTQALDAVLRSSISPRLLENLLQAELQGAPSKIKAFPTDPFRVWGAGGEAELANTEFVGVELDVDWSGLPKRALGILGGRPIHSLWPAGRGEGAIRIRRSGQELLAPFAKLQLPSFPEPAECSWLEVQGNRPIAGLIEEES
jgi:hypothetical protein